MMHRRSLVAGEPMSIPQLMALVGTQAEAAAAAGVSARTATYWAAGDREPTISQALALCDAAGVSPAVLAGWRQESALPLDVRRVFVEGGGTKEAPGDLPLEQLWHGDPPPLPLVDGSAPGWVRITETTGSQVHVRTRDRPSDPWVVVRVPRRGTVLTSGSRVEVVWVQERTTLIVELIGQ